MSKKRVLLLVDSDLAPPEDVKGADYTNEPWKTEYDVLVTLRGLGHEVRTIGMGRDLELIQQAQRQWRPHIAFNMLEDVYGVIQYDLNMVAFLELLGLAYTGCNPLGLQLSRDKALLKKVVSHHNVRTPRFMVCRRGRKVRRPARLGFPLIVKSLIDHASSGITQDSVVDDDASLQERVAAVHDELEADAIAEEFIPGREIYVSILGNVRLEVFPPWELIFENKPEDTHLIATSRAKWDPVYQKQMGVTTRRAEDLSEKFEAQLVRLSRRIYRALNLSGYARLDFRLSESGRPYLLEANPNPQLAYGEDYAESAHCAGISYEKLLQRIVNLGLRWSQTHQII